MCTDLEGLDKSRERNGMTAWRCSVKCYLAMNQSRGEVNGRLNETSEVRNPVKGTSKQLRAIKFR